jgi:acetyltransferase-like isoleucine patch superfamily enzyme
MSIIINQSIGLLISVLDPRSYLHVIRILHYYGYSHVRERHRINSGARSKIAPNVSLRNGNRITIGTDCQIGERSYLWAGDEFGRIHIGSDVSVAPGVFITASDYQFVKGTPFRSQSRRERDVWIGDDVWLGTRVVVTAGVSIGDGCIIGAGAVVTRNLPPGSIAVGVPARIIAVREKICLSSQ